MAQETHAKNSPKMSYRLEGTYSAYKYIQIEILDNNRCKLSYELYKEYISGGKERQRSIFFKLDDAKLNELISLYEKTDFCNLKLNETKARVTDVGIATLTYQCKGQERKLSYTYLKDNPLEELVKLYSNLARRYLPPVSRLHNY